MSRRSGRGSTKRHNAVYYQRVMALPMPCGHLVANASTVAREGYRERRCGMCGYIEKLEPSKK